MATADSKPTASTTWVWRQILAAQLADFQPKVGDVGVVANDRQPHVLCGFQVRPDRVRPGQTYQQLIAREGV